LKLTFIMIVLDLIDIDVIPQNTAPMLLVVEYGSVVKEKLRESIWHTCSISESDQKWNITKSSPQFLTSAKAIEVFKHDDNLAAVIQSNRFDALYEFPLLKNADGTISIDSKTSPKPINLGDATWMKIKIPNTQNWSTLATPFVTPKQWLFNPDILPLHNKTNLLIANSADASAQIFEISKNGVLETGSIMNCFEPRLIELNGNQYIFYKDSPADWSVYFNHQAYRTGFIPKPLPLMFRTLKDCSTVSEPVNLTMEKITQASLVFDVCTIGNSIVLATACRMLEKTFLQILVSKDYGKSWKLIDSTQLEGIPYRLKIGASNTQIIVASAFKQPDGFQIMATSLNLDL
jgi:hypothetical protein